MIDIAEIKRNVSPVEAIERYTGAKRTHNKYLCPFHNDRHPSLSVKADHWRCWTCDKGGDVINFTQLYFGISFKEAAIKLAEDFSIDIEISEPTDRNVWDQIKAECDRERRVEIIAIQEDIKHEIDLYTTAHRVLYGLGYREQVKSYSQKIDELEQQLQQLKQWR